MRAFSAVFAREIFARRFAFVVAFAAGFVPLIGSLAYGWRSPDAAEGRVLVALVGATALSAAFAILLGAAVIVGDTREKRISFYFSRPVPSGALWAGKLLAAIVITLATAFLAFAPGWLSGTTRARSLWGFDATPGRTALAALVLAVVCVLGSHAVVTVGRLRSPWVALDLILAPALVFLAAAFVRSLLRNSWADYSDAGVNPVAPAMIVLTAAFFVGLVGATFAQVAEGRTDARRAHGAFSLVLFGISGAAVALVGGYTWWCAAAKATDLESVVGGVQAAPRGSWLAASGPLWALRGGGTFLFEPTSGRSIRLRGWDVAFSQDGTRAAWGEPRFGFFEKKNNRSDIFVADLDTGRRVETGLEAPAWFSLSLSPSGRRLAVRDGKTLAAYDVSDARNPRQLAAFGLPDDVRTVAFVDEETIRLFRRFINVANRKDLASAALEITELSLSSKKSLVTGRFDRETPTWLRLSEDARFFVGTKRTTDDPRGIQVLTLLDGRTGALIATLAEDLRSPQLRFLTGGRMVVAGITGGRAGLLFFEGGQGPSRPVDLGPAGRIALGREIAPGRFAVALNASDANNLSSGRGWKLASVDVALGAVASLADGLVPATVWASWWGSAVLPPAEAGTPASALFLDADFRLVRLDPATGARTVILGRSK
jgi:hypothetical protein